METAKESAVETPFPVAEEAQQATVEMPDMPKFEASAASKELDDVIAATMARSSDMVGELTRMSFKERQLVFNQRLANMFAASGCFDDLKGMTPKQAVAAATLKIELGRTMGYEPADSLSIVHLIKGRVSIAASALASRLKREGYDWIFVRHDAKVCEVIPTKSGEPMMQAKLDGKGEPIIGDDGIPALEPARVKFTIEQADAAGLTKAGSAWKSYPEDMLFARVITRIKNRFAPEIMHGQNVITVEEARDIAAAEGPQRPSLPLKAGQQADGALVVDKVA